MASIWLTDSKVIFSEDNIMNINDFLYKMEIYVDETDEDAEEKYYVKYNKDTDEYSVRYGKNKYNVVLDQVEDKSIIKHLKSLAILHKMIKEKADFSKVETDQDINDAKELYLSLLKRNDYTIGDYFDGVSDDYSTAKKETGKDILDRHTGWAIIWGLVIFIGGIICAINYMPSEYYETTFVAIPAATLGAYPLYRLIKNYIRGRIERFKAYKKRNIVKKYVIKGLKKSLEKANELNINPEFQLKDTILQMIDNLTDKLAPIEPTTREELRKQLKSIFNDYLEIDETTELSFSERFLKRKDILDRLGKLEGDINLLKPTLGKKVNKSEVSYIRDRLNSLDTPSEEIQKKYRKAL